MRVTPWIRELRIERFKSFGTPGQAVSLGPLNFLVGANGSGKTNLICALRFLKEAVLNDVEFAAGELGGVREIYSRVALNGRRSRPIRIGLHLDMASAKVQVKDKSWEIQDCDYTVTLSVRRQREHIQIDSEELTANIRDEEGRSSSYRLRRSQQKVNIEDPVFGGENVGTLSVPEQGASLLALVGVGYLSPPSLILREVITDWRFYNISPRVARLPYREPAEPDLGPAGENLAVILHKLGQQDGGAPLQAVLTGLKGVVPGFEGVRTDRLPIEGKWAFQLLEERIHGAINPDSASDGTIRLLALLVIANWSAKHASTIAIEEPENGIHPHLYEHIVRILRLASDSGQLIVTTHSPTLLDYLAPEEVILCEKVDGLTRLMRASEIRQIDAFREQFSLGELWTQGALGGVP